MGPTYTTTVDLSGSANDVSVASVSGATSQVTAVSFLTGPQGADSTVPGPPGQDGADGVSDHTLLTNRGTNTHAQIDIALTRLANTSGTNTGDQDLSSYATSTEVSTGLATKANTTHSHVITDTTGLQTALDGKQASGDYATNTNLALKSNIADIVDNLTSISASTPLSANQGRVLKGLIDTINTALSSDDTTLDELQEIVNYIKLNRADLDTLSIPSIAGLQLALDSKSDVGHGHVKADVGLSNVDNTSDVNKPVSTAQAAADALKLDKVTTPSRMYAVDSNGAQYAIPWSSSSATMNNAVAVRSTGGELAVGTPTATVHATTKAYVDARIVQGTGFPNGVVTANVGTIYVDTAITNGASSWIKKVGTGNTGWQVLEGDTGWRSVGSLLVNGFTCTTPHIRRVKDEVFIRFVGLNTSSATSNTAMTMPVGFGTSQRIAVVMTTAVTGTSSALYTAQITWDDFLQVPTGTGLGYLSQSYISDDAWPTTLPGTAA